MKQSFELCLHMTNESQEIQDRGMGALDWQQSYDDRCGVIV